MTYGTLGLIDALAFGFGVLVEIPTGAVADLLGKRRTIIAAMATATLGIILMTHTWNQWGMLFGFLLAQLGWALYSGAGEAMAYDTLVDHKRESEFEKVISSASSAGLIVTVLTIIIGGLFYALYFQLPHILWWITYALGLILAFGITEPKADTEKFSWKGYFKQLSTGFGQLLSPKLRRYLVFILGLNGVFIIYDWGLVKPALLEHFGYFANEQALVFAVLGIIGAVFVKSLPKIRRTFGDIKGLYLLSMLIGFSYLIMYFNLGYYGLITVAIIDIFGRMIYPWLSVVVNKEIPSKYRATTISTSTLISRIPYVIVALLAGSAAENGTLNEFSLGIGTAFLAMIGLSVVLSFQKLFARINSKL